VGLFGGVVFMILGLPLREIPRQNPVHGGRLPDCSTRWLDLSTGIHPEPYPFHSPSLTSWAKLPNDDDGLSAIAARAYGAKSALAIAGSQSVIRQFPNYLEPGCVGLVFRSYGEYAPAFLRAGHTVRFLTQTDLMSDELPSELRYLVIVNPNNPTTLHISRQRLLKWHEQLLVRNGLLWVDETFADALPRTESVADKSHEPGWLVLKSLGKFFGLAGARVGAVLAHPEILQVIDRALGCWTINGAARSVAAQAWADYQWIEQRQKEIPLLGRWLAEQLEAVLHAPVQQAGLFAWTIAPLAWELHQHLASQFIHTRWFEPNAEMNELGGMRVGLPAASFTHPDWQRFTDALHTFRPL
jgi:cobalamin biosynthesis protein CobC